MSPASVRGAVAALALCSAVAAATPARAHGQWLDAILHLTPERPRAGEPALLEVRLVDRLSQGPIIGARVTYRARLAGGHVQTAGELKEIEAARYVGRLRLPGDGLWNLTVIVENLDEVIGGAYRVAVGPAGGDVAPLRGVRDPLGWVPEDPVPAGSVWPAAMAAGALLAGTAWVVRFMRRAAARRTA